MWEETGYGSKHLKEEHVLEKWFLKEIISIRKIRWPLEVYWKMHFDLCRMWRGSGVDNMLRWNQEFKELTDEIRAWERNEKWERVYLLPNAREIGDKLLIPPKRRLRGQRCSTMADYKYGGEERCHVKIKSSFSIPKLGGGEPIVRDEK